MRYSHVVHLYNETTSSDSAGNPVIERSGGSMVFANIYSIGASAWLAARAAGLHPEAEIEIRSIDYDGQNVAVMNGTEYTVEQAPGGGEFTRLVLTHRLSNKVRP